MKHKKMLFNGAIAKGLNAIVANDSLVGSFLPS